jgi:uncharacterized protein YxeA
MKKIIIYIIATVVLYYLSVSYLTSKIEKEQNKYKVKIGTKYVLEKDTLTVVDYSSILETFTLSNEKTVNASLILQQPN